MDDSPLPNCSIWDVVLTDRDKQLLSELRRASAMALPRCVVSRYATAWAESLEGAMSGHHSFTLLCRYRCRLLLVEIPVLALQMCCTIHSALHVAEIATVAV